MPVSNWSLDDLVGLFRGGERLARHLELLVEREHRQVLVGDLGDQQDLRGLPGIPGGEILLERGVAQALHAAEEIDLPGRGNAGFV